MNFKSRQVIRLIRKSEIIAYNMYNRYYTRYSKILEYSTHSLTIRSDCDLIYEIRVHFMTLQQYLMLSCSKQTTVLDRFLVFYWTILWIVLCISLNYNSTYLPHLVVDIIYIWHLLAMEGNMKHFLLVNNIIINLLKL